MAIFKRGRVYWYHFIFSGQHVQQSTKQGNPRVARQIEAAHRTQLAKGEVGIVERKPAPILKGFAQRFIDAVQIRSRRAALTMNLLPSRENYILSRFKSEQEDKALRARLRERLGK